MSPQEAILFLKSKLSSIAEIYLNGDEITCYYRLKSYDILLYDFVFFSFFKEFVSAELALVKEEMKKSGFGLKTRPGFKGKPTTIWSHYESKTFVGSGFVFKKQ